MAWLDSLRPTLGLSGLVVVPLLASVLTCAPSDAASSTTGPKEGSTATTDGWPQILGPRRDGSTMETLPERFADGGPRVLWRRDVGEGMAGVAVVAGGARGRAGDHIVLFHRVDDAERLELLDAADGATRWRRDEPVRYRGGILPDSGPRAVPLVAQLADRRAVVIALGVAGALRVHALGDGAPLWRVDLAAVFKAPEGYFGVGTTPLVAATPDGPVLIVNVGADDAGVVGFDLATGTVRWRTADARASYSAPVLAASESAAPAVIVPTRLFTTALDPATGRELWRVPFGQRGPSVVAALPVVVDDQVLLTASYGVGARLLDLSGSAGDAPTVGWSSASLSSHYPTPVVVDGFVYGIDGREDVGSAHLRCLDLTTGDVRWSVDGFGIAHLLTDGQRLLIQRLDGEIILADASAEAFRPLARAAVAEGPVRALPALSGGVLYLRTTPSRGGGELLAIVLGAS